MKIAKSRTQLSFFTHHNFLSCDENGSLLTKREVLPSIGFSSGRIFENSFPKESQRSIIRNI